jgi:protein-disulfide isomerase
MLNTVKRHGGLRMRKRATGRSLRRCAGFSLLIVMLAACGNTSVASVRPAPTGVPSTTTASGDAQGRIAEGYHFRGAADAPIIMQDFSDLLCDECRAFATQTEPKIDAVYITTGKVKFVFRHLLQLGEGSVRTAEASECAGDQNQFWPMHDLLYTRQDAVYATSDLDATLVAFAKELRLDSPAFESCMQTHKYLEAVQNDYRAAQRAGIRSRPAFDINGTRLVGAQPFSVFQKVIDTAIAK